MLNLSFAKSATTISADSSSNQQIIRIAVSASYGVRDPPYRKLSRLSYPLQRGRFFGWDRSQVSEVVELVLEPFGSCQRAGLAGFGTLHDRCGLTVEVSRGVNFHNLNTTSTVYYIQGI